MNDFPYGDGSFGNGFFGVPYKVQSLRAGLLGLTPQKSSIHKGFEVCLSRIELDPTRVTEASQHYNAVKDWIESRIYKTVRQVGSFQRKTKIRPIVEKGVVEPIDIDATVCFGDAHYYSSDGTTGPSALQQVSDALRSNKTYRLLEPKIDHPVVTLSYANEFFMELIPCFRNRIPPHALREPASYFVANSSGHWEIADYDFDSQYITAANKKTGGKLVPAIKLMKRLCRNKNIAVKSFHIEMLCALLLEPFGEELGNWEWQQVLVYFLTNAPVLLDYDLVLPGSMTPAFKSPNPYIAQSQMRAVGKTLEALNQLPDGSNKFSRFQEFFGAPFPASL